VAIDKETIREFARGLGATLVGFAPAALVYGAAVMANWPGTGWETKTAAMRGEGGNI
jgi:hypothetical protein